MLILFAIHIKLICVPDLKSKYNMFVYPYSCKSVSKTILCKKVNKTRHSTSCTLETSLPLQETLNYKYFSLKN